VGVEAVKGGFVALGSFQCDSGECATIVRESARQALARITCDEATREAIFEHVPQAGEDKTLFRFAVYALWATWRDEGTNLRVIDKRVLAWIGETNSELCGANGEVVGDRVLKHVARFLPIDYVEWIPKRRARLLKDDGLPPKLWKTVQADLSRPVGSYDRRVYVLSGKAYDDHVSPYKLRDAHEMGAQEAEALAPSPLALHNMRRLNDRPGNTFASMRRRMDDAYAYVRHMHIPVKLSAKTKARLSESEQEARRAKVARQLRTSYLACLRSIEDQPQPFYAPSRKGKTDRLFGYNTSVLQLPKAVRRILCRGWYEVDLKSAHLLIAAWLWDAESALAKLTTDGYSVWTDLIEHCKPLFDERNLDVPSKGTDLYEVVKGALKVAVYSTVYGMRAPAVQAGLTRRLKGILGPTVGAHIRTHTIISELLQKREARLRRMQVGDRLEGPTGIEIVIEVNYDDESGSDDFVGPRSAMATLAQSYEQALMGVILDLEEERSEKKSNRFRVCLWLHDGAYVKMRSVHARMKDLQRRLDAKAKELARFAGKVTALPAFFETEKITAPTPVTWHTSSTSSTTLPETSQLAAETGTASQSGLEQLPISTRTRSDTSPPVTDAGSRSEDLPPSTRRGSATRRASRLCGTR
jgi:hypothetical protein